MELQITAKNTEIKPRVRDYTEKKLNKFSRFLPNIMEAIVELSEQNTKSLEDHYRAEVTITINGTILRGEARGQSFREAIDRVEDIMNRRIEHYKGKIQEKPTSSVRTTNIPEPVTYPITKTKRFSLSAMPPDGAAEQMTLLGHSFYLFINEDTDMVNLVYRRNDDSYGLIIPEIR